MLFPFEEGQNNGHEKERSRGQRNFSTITEKCVRIKLK